MPPPPAITLVAYHGDGITTAPLVPDQPLVVGRDESSDLCVSGNGLSREHARFSLVGGCIRVEDLGSTNGTWLGEQRVERADLALGDEVMLGTVVVRVLAFGQAADPTLESEVAFRRQLDAELSRAQLFRRPFAVLAVRVEDAPPEPGGIWATRLRESLRPIDRVSLYTPSVALVLLPEAGIDVASQMARDLDARSTGQGGARLLVGVAVYPATASTAGELVDRAREAAERARLSSPVVVASTAAWTQDVDRSGMIVGAALRKVLEMAERFASAPFPVLLHGETGTGKELFASYIHEHGPRRDKPFIRLNCGAIPASLLESTFFGHERGAFTGAVQQKPGAFEDADEGTLFLDEIGELSEAAQVALLRVLETGELSRVGTAQVTKVDVRVIAATHRDLGAMVAGGRFREDLYYRLSTLVLEIPPLRERLDEIDRLAQRFLANASKANGKSVLCVADEALALLRAYAWPGNVRELRNAIERAVVVALGDVIQPEDLPATVREARSVARGGKLEAQLEQTEALAIEDALRRTNWNESKAADLLGMDRSKLRRRRAQYGIKKPKP